MEPSTVFSKKCYGTHKSGAQCGLGVREVRESFPKWVVALLSSEGVKRVNQGRRQERIRVFLAEQVVCEPQD